MANIVLIGPMAVGKTTCSKILSTKLNIPRYERDEFGIKYYEEINYDESELVKMYKDSGLMGIFEYGKKFEAYTVKRMMEDHNNSIIDFGAGSSMFEGELLAQVKAVLSSHKVILLLPSENNELSMSILSERYKERKNNEEVPKDELELLRNTITYPSHKELANYVLIIDEKNPEEVAEEIISIL